MPVDFERQRGVVQSRSPWQEQIALTHVGRGAETVLRVDDATGEGDFASCLGKESSNDVEQRAFAGAGRADEGDEFPVGDVE